jgi:hypothetical protein
MTIVRGHFDGKVIVLDEPIPSEIAPNTPVRILIDEASGTNALDRIAELAGPADLPPDFSEQHDSYVRGGPKR